MTAFLRARSVLVRTTVPAMLALALVLVACACTAPPAIADERDVDYLAVEVNGTLCGYTKTSEREETVDGRTMRIVEDEVFIMMSALGSEFNTEVRVRFVVDPATGRYTHGRVDAKQGQLDIFWEVVVEGNTATITSSLMPEPKVLELAADVVMEVSGSMPHLERDFVERGLDEVTYELLEVRDAAVQSTRYRKVAEETLELAGRTFDTVKLEKANLVTGLKFFVWMDKATAELVQIEVPGSRRIYLADASVTKKVEVANLDKNITTPVAVSIPDFQGITRMKVRAVLEPYGLVVTEESLNVPGQTFVGTVEENRIEGVFEIEHPRYDGANAPPFPPDFADDPALAAYLEAGDLIESHDPVLIAAARDITAGAADSWEATRRIAQWVAENITYAIPGGGTARRTYDMRAGECGSHSNLVAAMSRAVGIPARVVWGCMYIPNFGGAFGQHGWNEVYMGEAGWIPLDATAFEADYVDSGHVRIGTHESMTTALNPIEMEILDYATAAGTAVPAAEVSAAHAPYLGTYKHAQAPVTVNVREQDGALVADLPGNVALAVNEPDADGHWTAKAAPHVYLAFSEDADGKIDAVEIHEMVRMQRTADPDSIPEDVPERYRRYLGSYLLAQLNATFTVKFHDGRLAVHDPTKNVDVHLQEPDEHGGWLDEYGKNTLFFEEDDAGTITTLRIDARTRFARE